MKFRLNDLRDEVTVRALQSFEILLDTVDYVPPKYLKKIQGLTFKLFRKQYRRARWGEWQPPEPPPAEETAAEPSQPAPVINVMQIETAPPEKQIESVLLQLAAYQKEYPELVERLLEKREEVDNDTD